MAAGVGREPALEGLPREPAGSGAVRHDVRDGLTAHRERDPLPRTDRVEHAGGLVPQFPDAVGSADLISDALACSGRFRTFNVVDDFNREALHLEVDTLDLSLRLWCREVGAPEPVSGRARSTPPGAASPLPRTSSRRGR